MTYNKVRRKIKKLLTNESKNIIIKHKNKYIVYKIYTITNKYGLWEVKKYDEIKHSFVMSSSAISYCIADKHILLEISNNLVILNEMLLRRKNTILFNKELLKCNYSYLLLNRIGEDIHQYKMLEIEINKCSKLTKYIQIKDLFNELKRPKRKRYS